MSRTSAAGLRFRAWGFGIFLLLLTALGCDSDPSSQPSARQAGGPTSSGDQVAQAQAATPEAKPGEVKRVLVNKTDKNVWLEIQGKDRRVGVACEVCLRKAGFGLECLLCRKNTKEHESILSTEADARNIHLGLVAAGGKTGAPVQFDPKLKPPSGQRIRITLAFEHQGKRFRIPAQQWVRNVKTKKDLDQDWVFAGSKLIPDPVDPKRPQLYLAQNDGAFIAISNVPTAMLDLPIDSPKGVEDRGFDTHERRIPPLGTKVTLVLEPIPDKQKREPIPEKYPGPLFETEPGRD